MKTDLTFGLSPAKKLVIGVATFGVTAAPSLHSLSEHVVHRPYGLYEARVGSGQREWGEEPHTHRESERYPFENHEQRFTQSGTLNSADYARYGRVPVQTFVASGVLPELR